MGKLHLQFFSYRKKSCTSLDIKDKSETRHHDVKYH